MIFKKKKEQVQIINRGTPFYDNFQFSLYFCAFSRLSISGNCNGFFISSCSKKQDCLDLRGPNLIRFFFET